MENHERPDQLVEQVSESAVTDDDVIAADSSEETATCRQCGRVYHGIKGKFPTAQQKLNTHLTRSHGANAKRRGNTVTDVAVRIGEISRDTPKAPTAAEWRDALGTLLSGVSSIPAGIIADSDPVINTMFPPSERPARVKELESRLTLAKEDAEVVASPIARTIASTTWNAKSGRTVINNADFISAGAIVVSLVIEWRRYLGQRKLAQEAIASKNNSYSTMPNLPRSN